MATSKKKTAKPLVGIVMGSDSDYAIMSEASKILDQFGVANEVLVTSAHRTPARTRKYVEQCRKRGIKVLIAGAGAAAHLAGVIAAETILPVIGVPIGSSPSARDSTPCSPPHKCREAFPSPPWPSAKPERKMRESWPFKCWP